MNKLLSRRDFLNHAAMASAGLGLLAQARAADTNSIVTVDPAPRFDLSPHLYMQFMEPLGSTDGSVAAAWDYQHHQWRKDVVQVTQQLAPPLMRWGGCLSSYYRWKEAVGPRTQRVPMHNLLWGGMEDNRVGTV